MAKRKKQRKEESESSNIGIIVTGIAFMLFAFLGTGPYGLIGEIVKKFAIFMFGSWWILFLGFCLVLGLYMVAKRENAKYFTPRLIGIYAIIITILVFSHVSYIKVNQLEVKNILSSSFDNIKLAFANEALISNTGGGIIGSLFSVMFVYFFAVEGTYIFAALILLFGIIMLFNITLADLFDGIINFFKKLFGKGESSDDEEDESEESESSDEEEEPVDKRIKIHSVEELKNYTGEDVQPEVSAPVVETNQGDNRYVKPSIALLDINKNKNNKVNSNEYIANCTKTLERVFEDFNMRAKVIEVHVGPAVTQFEMSIDRGTKLNKVLSISREIALALAAKEVRIEAPIPGKNTIGVEIPNQNILAVSMREIMEEMERNKKLADCKLAAPLGRDIMGRVKYVDIAKTPHMLVAGSTGSGKSVCINNIIMSIIMRTTPDEVKMVLVDPKKVEFSVYDGIPHLLMPVVTDPKKANVALQKIGVEMDERYDIFKNSGTKNIISYNEEIEKELKKNPDCGKAKMPYILVIIDELADLMLVAAKEVEESIMRITQLARAAGIHLIVATQRPSTNVVTGVIKANIPTRVSFAVSSSIDSRTILDMTGAEKLLGRGDMLYKPQDENTPTRVQGSFVSDDEIKRVVDFVKKRTHAPKYDEKFTNLEASSGGGGALPGNGGESQKDVLYDEVLNYAIRMGQISASLIQRKYSIGYNRAARIMDMFEEKGIVGPAKGSKPRDVLVKLEEPKE